MVDKLGTIKLNGHNYRIDLESYRCRDVSDYSPRASTPGGGIVYSEMALYQPLAQNDWRHGLGFLWHTDSAGFYDTEGNMETRFPGMAMPFTKPVNIAGGADYAKNGGFTLLHDGNILLAWGDTGATAVYNIGTDQWFEVSALAGKTINSVWSNGTYDFLLVNGERILRVASWIAGADLTATGGGADYLEDTDGITTDDTHNGKLVEITAGTGSGQVRFVADTVASTNRITVSVNWTTNPDATSVYRFWEIYETGVNTNSTDYRWMVAHDGFVFAGKDGTNQVYYGSEETLSDLHGLPADDPNVLYVGVTGRAVKGAVSFSGDLFFYRDDGLYRMDKDRTAARKVLDYSDQASSLNFSSVAVYNGSLYFPIRAQLYQWNGVRVTPVTPQRVGETYPYQTYIEFDNLVVSGNFLMLTAKRMEAPGLMVWYTTDLLAFDGVGWHKLVTKVGNAQLTIEEGQATLDAFNLVVSATQDALWLHTTAVSGTATGGTYRIRLNREGDYPFPLFDEDVTTNALITSRFDAGFRRVVKSTPSILFDISGTESGTDLVGAIYVYYRTDTVTEWTAWGGNDRTSNRLAPNGLIELKDPGGTAADTLEYRWLQLRLQFETTSATVAPVLEAIILRVLLRPDSMYGYSCNIIAASSVEYNSAMTSTDSPYTLLSNLRAARDSAEPVDFTTPFGTTVKVYVTSLTELALEHHVSDMGAYPDIEHIVQINMIDVDSYAVRAARGGGVI